MSGKFFHLLFLRHINCSPTWVHKQGLEQELFAGVAADGEATQLLYVVPPLGFLCQTFPDFIQGLPIKHIKELQVFQIIRSYDRSNFAHSRKSSSFNPT